MGLSAMAFGGVGIGAGEILVGLSIARKNAKSRTRRSDEGQPMKIWIGCGCRVEILPKVPGKLV